MQQQVEQETAYSAVEVHMYSPPETAGSEDRGRQEGGKGELFQDVLTHTHVPYIVFNPKETLKIGLKARLESVVICQVHVRTAY